jgi:glutamate-1-semialdehyde 2,1-aminomutase
MVATQQMTIEQEYVAKRPRSAQIAEQARTVLVNGVTHECRYVHPFQPYAVRAQGARKWDVDGNEYIDYLGGHGSLLLGHGRPEVVKAIQEQVALGTHYSMCHELEVRWAQIVQQLIPSIEEIRFHASGTEATMMAMRLARAYTGRSKILKFEGGFHGWHDYATVGLMPPFDVPASVGVPGETASTVLVAPNNDLAAVEAFLARGDVAAVILEPTGSDMGKIPFSKEFLQGLRAATTRHGTVLIFDEVITGFRVHPGGVQSLWGVIPDLTTLGKVLGGGIAGGAAVGGKREIMGGLRIKDDPKLDRFNRINHPGTFNASPLSAAAGIACLSIVAKGEVHEHAFAMSDRLQNGLNQVLRTRGIPGGVHGQRTMLHCVVGSDQKPEDMNWGPTMPAKLVLAMMVEGVHFDWCFVSAAHTEDDIDQTIDAFDRALVRTDREGGLVL